MLSIRNLVKIYPGPVAALVGVDLDVPQWDVRPARSQRGGQDDLDADPGRGAGGRLRARPRSTAIDARSARADAGTAGLPPAGFRVLPPPHGRADAPLLAPLEGGPGTGRREGSVPELLERVHLSFAARRKVKTYSGGMRQRLGIAQAIAGNPRLIIVDEPTAGLDPEERLRFYRLLSELAEDRIVVLSTHIVEDVAVLCPRFAVIRDGRLIADTTPSRARRAIEGTIYEGTIPAESYDRLLGIPIVASRKRTSSKVRTVSDSTNPTGARRRASQRSRRPWKTPTSSRSRPAVFVVSPTARSQRRPSPTARPMGSPPNRPPPSEVRDERNPESRLEADVDGLQR